MSDKKDQQTNLLRRRILTAGGAFALAGAMPMFYTRNAWAKNFPNDPSKLSTVTLGFNIPQSGAYADEGADELRAYKLAVKH